MKVYSNYANRANYTQREAIWTIVVNGERNFKKYSNSLIGIIRCKFCVHYFSVQFCNKTNGGDSKHWKKDCFYSSLKKREKMLRSLSIERKIRISHNTENKCVLLSQCWTILETDIICLLYAKTLLNLCNVAKILTLTIKCAN